MGPDPFDLRFATTLLSANVFAGVQAKITDQIRRKQATDEALRAALAAGRRDTSYDEAFARRLARWRRRLSICFAASGRTACVAARRNRDLFEMALRELYA